MLRSVCVFAALLAAQFAHAGEAGKVIFVAGKAQIVDRPATLGLGVQEGELMKTGADGFIYIKTCLLYTSPSPRDRTRSRMPSSA